MLQIARDLTRYNHHGAPCTALANRVARTAATVIATIFGSVCLTLLWLTVLAPLFGPLVSSARAESRDIVVFGSIALKEALNEANDYFLKENGIRAVTTYGASTAFAKQIEGGMPGDLFFAGDVASMDYLAERNLIKPGTRKDLLRNRLVLIAPANSMLTRAVLTKVARGEFPLGIIWQTDTANEQGIRIVATLPEASHPPIVYPLAVLANSTHETVSSYLQYLLSPKAAPFFQKRGFTVF